MHNNLSDESYDILILGGGISAMLTALALSRIGKKIAIIEKLSLDSNKNTFFDNRTTAFTNHSWSYLKNLLGDKYLKKLTCLAGEIKDIYILDNKSSYYMLNFPTRLSKHQAIGYIVKNSDFKELLKQVIITPLITVYNSEIEEIFNDQILDDPYILKLSNGYTITGDLVIFTSKSNLPLYKKYFSAYIDKDYSQTAITFNIEHTKPHEGTAVEHFLTEGPFAILPMSNSYNSSIVWTVDNNMAKILLTLSDEEFIYNVKNFFGPFLGDIKLISNINNFPLKAYITNNYFYQRIILLAGGAHVIHPLAGQGLNQGIKDIEALITALDQSLPLLTQLNKYEKLRRNDNINMYLVTDSLNRIFSNKNFLLSKTRKIALLTIEKLEMVKKQLINYASGSR